MHIDLNCPPNGCDPWDRYANISVVKNDGSTVEIGRYITPYGIGTCGWTLDVSDYREMLRGEVTLRSGIETINIQNLWYGFDSGSSRNYSNYHVGDTLWTLDNLPARTVTIPTNAEQVIFKVNNTGHGQGNTLNAAEFRPVNHMIRVNGQTTHVHDMWKNDCGQNPCSPLYPYCEPADDCAFGTQIGCGYDGQLHTPPTYKMAIQLIIKSSSPLTSIDEVANWSNFSVFPNPSNGNFNVNVTFDEPQQALINIIDTTGKNVFQRSPSPTLHLNETLNLSQLSSGMYFLEVQTNEGSTFKKIIIN